MAASNMAIKETDSQKDVASGEHPFGHAGQFICLIVFLAIWGLDSFVFRFSTFLTQSVPFYVRWTAAAAVFALGICLIRSGHRAVPDESTDGGRLIKDGAFAYLRHPLYAGSLLIYLSLVLGSLSLISLAVFGVVFLFYNAISTYEEKVLTRKYGRDYEEYSRKVLKWIPRPRRGRS